MRSMILALLFVPVLAISASAFGAEPKTETAQDAYAKFEATTSDLQQQLYAKQAELNALMANNQAQSPRVQELFTEIGGLEGQLYAARSELYSSLNGRTSFRGGFGNGYCGGYGYSGYGNGGGCCW